MAWIHKIGAVTYQVREDQHRPQAPIVERWTLASRKTGRWHWVEVTPRMGAYLEVLQIYERMKRERAADVS